ncbi:MAG: hypothetical protein N3F11_05655 [Casimicrobiaceae bacterium]|nr:hypothetical protein [Casimicrobiaceae bacterium]
MKPLYPRPEALARILERAPEFSAGLRVARRHTVLPRDLLAAIFPPQLLPHVARCHREPDGRLVVALTCPEALHAVHRRQAEILVAANAKALKCNDLVARLQIAPPKPSWPRCEPSPETAEALRRAAASLKSERMQTAVRRLARSIASASAQKRSG